MDKIEILQKRLTRRSIVAIEKIDHQAFHTPRLVQRHGCIQVFVERFPVNPKANADAALARVGEYL